MTDTTRNIAKTKFIEALSSQKSGGNISYACKAIGYSRQSVASWRRADQDFDRAASEAVMLGKDILADTAEQALVKRVNEGNVTAIIFTLKCLRPERWNDKYAISRVPTGEKIEDRFAISPEFAGALNRFVSK